MQEIIEVVKRKVDVKIVIGMFDKAKWNHQKERHWIAAEAILRVTKIKIKRDYHGRMLIADDVLIVGSADIDSQGLQVHENIVAQTDEQTAVIRAKQIFEELYNSSEDLAI